MNLNEQLEEKKSQLLELKEGVESGDSEATSKASQLVDEITSLQEQIKVADEKQALLDAMKSAEPINQTIEKKEIKMGNIFDSAIEAVKSVDTASEFHVSTGFKAATDVITTPELADVDKTAPAIPTHRAAASMLGAATVSGNAVTYFVEKSEEGDIAVVGENGKKPQLSFSYEPVTVSLKKIAGYIKETSEIIEDATFLTSAIQNKLLYKLYKAEDKEVVTAIAETEGIKEVEYKGNDKDKSANAIAIVDAIAEAISVIANGSAYTADGIFMNPADVLALRQSKDNNGQYYLGGFVAGAYGTEGIKNPDSVWGLPVFESADVEAGTVLVGAFKTCATVYRKNGVNVSVSNSNEDDFIYNRVTILAEERFVPVVTVPAGIVSVKKATE